MAVIRVTGYLKAPASGDAHEFEVDLDKTEWDRKDARERHAMILQTLTNQGHLEYAYAVEEVE